MMKFKVILPLIVTGTVSASISIGIPFPELSLTSWTVLKTWQIGSFSDFIGLGVFGAKACGGSQGYSISMIG
jgi:hypothetical protein